MALRDAFPVLEHTAYLNSGTDGPIPRAAAEQARAEIAAEASEGRLWPHFDRRRALTDDLRAGYARVLGLRARGRRGDERDQRRARLRAGRAGPRPRRRAHHLRATSTRA